MTGTKLEDGEPSRAPPGTKREDLLLRVSGAEDFLRHTYGDRITGPECRRNVPTVFLFVGRPWDSYTGEPRGSRSGSVETVEPHEYSEEEHNGGGS